MQLPDLIADRLEENGYGVSRRAVTIGVVDWGHAHFDDICVLAVSRGSWWIKSAQLVCYRPFGSNCPRVFVIANDDRFRRELMGLISGLSLVDLGATEWQEENNAKDRRHEHGP